MDNKKETATEKDEDETRFLSSILDEMGPALLGYLKTILRDEQSAEDVFQNVFIRFVKAQRSGYEIRHLRAFLYTLARHEALREIGKKPKEEPTADTVIDRMYDPLPQGALSAEEVETLQEAMLCLPPLQREILYLKFYSGMTLEEIGNFLSISMNTAASRYRYALEKLRALLGANG